MKHTKLILSICLNIGMLFSVYIYFTLVKYLSNILFDRLLPGSGNFITAFYSTCYLFGVALICAMSFFLLTKLYIRLSLAISKHFGTR